MIGDNPLIDEPFSNENGLLTVTLRCELNATKDLRLIFFVEIDFDNERRVKE